MLNVQLSFTSDLSILTALTYKYSRITSTAHALLEWRWFFEKSSRLTFHFLGLMDSSTSYTYSYINEIGFYYHLVKICSLFSPLWQTEEANFFANLLWIYLVTKIYILMSLRGFLHRNESSKYQISLQFRMRETATKILNCSVPSLRKPPNKKVWVLNDTRF